MSGQVQDLATAVDLAKRGQQSMVKCLAHDDGTASVHVSPGTGAQPVVIKCFALCENEDVIAAAGLTWADICAPLEVTSRDSGEWTPVGTASRVYDYCDEQGTLLFQALRVPTADGGKRFLQRQPSDEPGREWTWNLQGVRRVLYRLPAVLRAKDEGRDIWVFEGEKDADTAVMDGLVGTTCPMGAGKWLPAYTETLRGARVHVVADSDGPGQEHAREVSEALVAAECEVWRHESQIAKDYTDHRLAGGTVETLHTTFYSGKGKSARPEYGIRSFISTDFTNGREIIPGHFAQANIAIIVGSEGFGKSVLMRQMAVQCAAGINPFTSANMEPLRVLYIDGENPESQQKIDWVKLDRLATRYTGMEIPEERLTIVAAWEDTPDLIMPSGIEWFSERIEAYRPDICFLGPVSDVVEGNLEDSSVVRKFKRTLYRARAICGTAFIVEHHAPHRMQGDKTRELRPYGSSVFRRFPDFGYGITPTDVEGEFKMAPFRGARVRDRAWPDQIRWGNPTSMEWPWEFGTDVRGSVTVGNFGS